MAGTTRFSELKELYSGLSRGEKQTLSTYAMSFERDLIPSFRLAGSFIDLLESDEDISLEKIIKKLKLDPKDNLSINTLILKVQELILQTPLLDQNLHRPGVYRNRFRIRAANEKKLIQAEIFLDRGIMEPVEKILSDVQTKADKYELPAQAVTSLKLQQIMAAQWRSLRTFNRLESDLEEARRRDVLLNRAEDTYLLFRLTQKREPENKEAFSGYLEDLKTILKSYDSDMVKYYAGHVQIAIDRLDNAHGQAINQIESLLELVRQSSPLKSKRVESDLHYELGVFNMQRRNIEAAKAAFTEGEKLVKNDTYENFRFKRDLLLMDLYQEKLDQAKDTIDTRINSTYIRQRSFASAQYHYLRAVWAYLSRNHKMAIRQLSEEIKVMEAPESREALGYHLVLVMAAAEMQDQKLASSKEIAEAMDTAQQSVRHLRAIKSRTDITARDLTIIRMMLRLADNDFDFKKSYAKIKRFLVRMRKPKADLIWQPFTYEVIPMHYWYEAQIDRRRSKMKLPPPPGTAEETPDLTGMTEEADKKPKAKKRGRPKKRGRKPKSAAAKARDKKAKAKKTKTQAAKTPKAKTAKASASAKPTGKKRGRPKKKKEEDK